MFNIYQYRIMTNHLFVCSGLTKQCGFLKSLVPSQQSQVSLALAIPGTGLRRLMGRSGTKLQGYDDIMIFLYAKVQVVKALSLCRNHFFQTKYYPLIYCVNFSITNLSNYLLDQSFPKIQSYHPKESNEYLARCKLIGACCGY